MIKEDQVQENLNKPDTHKSMGPDGVHPRVLRELADVIAEPLSIIFESFWRAGKVPTGWRKANVTAVFKGARRRTQGTTVQSASPPSLERRWSSSFWRSSLSNWRKRRLSGVVNMDSPRGNHA